MGQVGGTILTAPDATNGSGGNPFVAIAQVAGGAFATYEQASTASKLAKKVGGSPVTYIVLGVAAVGIVGAVLLLKK